MIDVHCHLNFHAYAKDYDECIKRAKEKGVKTIINVGTKIDSSEKAVELANTYDNLYAIVGVHPHHADKMEFPVISSETRDLPRDEISHSVRNDKASWLAQLEQLAKQPKVVAIGEIGLDYYRYQSNGIVDPDTQKEFFEAQIELAHRVGLPIQIHNRHAGKDIIEILKHHKNLLMTDFPGMFHCFAGSKEVLQDALDLGFMIGFDGNSTYPGLAPLETTSLTELAKYTPLDRLLTETDSPFLTPIPHRGTRNEPSYVIIVGEFLAKVKGVNFEKIDQQTTKNARELFHLKD
ncbi:MAG TPA: TatD family hydrolase [Candidatus Eisenbacteria bacterium]|nr:TatD family hydrolase [Candidatus Eisenbacteria bacterium]